MTSYRFPTANLKGMKRPELLSLANEVHEWSSAFRDADLSTAAAIKRMIIDAQATYRNSQFPARQAPGTRSAEVRRPAGISASECNAWLKTLPEFKPSEVGNGER